MSKRQRKTPLFQKELVNQALVQSIVKLNPRIMFRNPVMFTVEIGTAIMLLVTIYSMVSADGSQGSVGYNLSIFIILLLTLLFANFAEALAEARGKAQAESLRKTRQDTAAKKVMNAGNMFQNETKVIPSSQLNKGDYFTVRAGLF
mgnify:CR=1 FL=1